MGGKPKNLNRESHRQFLLEQRKAIDRQLSETQNLYQKDMEDYLVKYERSLSYHEFALNTKKTYLRIPKRFVKTYTNNDVPLSKEVVIQFKDNIIEKYRSVSTMNTYITALNRFLYFCDADLFKIEKVKGQNVNAIKYRIYDHEYKRLCMKAKTLGMMCHYFAMRIMGETGVRVDELKYFTGTSIQKSYVSVTNKGKTRSVPLPTKIRTDLRKYVKDNEITDDPIVNIDYNDLYKGLKSIAGACKINKKKIHPHAFRHYFSFNFVKRKGAQLLPRLADILGHSSMETTRKYVRGTLDDYLADMEDIK